ncbi:Tryptophan 2,3-dioxygenase [Labilithrix luteola]|uniref:Tryptophan 2,3-dioxygenase n=1 Tax=Labilithrix luteola TaxID=1391654 RepID=A0A0K1PZX4_9BACT|nr:tryptophan 2,3-dioxygenase family protein [Labilithrix luteola]AKU99085.1 Tryptophan 2,3-dioxygenase [Labilithrix luteola]
MSKCSGRFATDLANALERPVFNRQLGKDVGRGDLDYEVYLQTKSLFELQIKREVAAPDEHLFQVMHQTQELWLKAIAFDTISLVDAFDEDHLHEASALLERIVLVQRSLASEMRILQTLTPKTFQAIRRNLGNGSGLESPGYNRLLLATDAVEQAFTRALERTGTSIVELYATERQEQAGLLRVAELLVDWDEAFQTWLVAHFMLVRRTIGVDREVLALDGFPTRALAPRMTAPLFPALWDARVKLTKAWVREGGYPIGAPRVGSGCKVHAPNATEAAAANGNSPSTQAPGVTQFGADADGAR